MMKKLLYFALTVILFVACQKEYLVPAREVPAWLKERIAADEKAIQENPKTMNSYGAWMRYEFRGKMYYEYLNALSSRFPNIYNEQGQEIDPFEGAHQGYWDGRCCGRYIWKAPGYSGIQ